MFYDIVDQRSIPCRKVGTKRRVHFANISSCKVVHECSSLGNDEDVTSVQDPTSNPDSVAAALVVPNRETACCRPNIPRPEPCGCASPSDEEEESLLLVRTKEDDGPGPTALTTHTLVALLVKQGSVSPTEIVEHLQVQVLAPCPAHGPQPDADDEDIAANRRLTDPAASPVDRHLCVCVAARLAALRDRIRACGSAVLPPSRAVMGPPFVPALEFLRGLVLDAAGGGGGGRCESGCDSAGVGRRKRCGPESAEAAERRGRRARPAGGPCPSCRDGADAA